MTGKHPHWSSQIFSMNDKRSFAGCGTPVDVFSDLRIFRKKLMGMGWLIWGRFSTWNVQFLVDFYLKNLKNWWKITWNPISQASWLIFSWVWVKSMIFAVSSVQKSRFDMISPIQTIDLVTKNGGGWQNHGIWNWMTRWQMNILLRLFKKTRHKGSLECPRVAVFPIFRDCCLCPPKL